MHESRISGEGTLDFNLSGAMASFKMSGEFFQVSLITGPSSALVRIRFSDAHEGDPAIRVLLPDHHYGTLDSSELVAVITRAVSKANAEFGLQLLPAEIEYRSDNDPGGALIRRCTYLIVRRIAKFGQLEFAGME